MSKPRMSGQESEDARLERVREFARILDDSIRIPGTNLRFGLDPIIGLVPGLGDWIGGAASAYVLLTAARLGASKATLLRMAANVGIESLVGMVPGLGDLFDAGFKANARNVRLMEAQLDTPGETARASRAWVIGAVTFVIVIALALGALGIWFTAWLIGQVGLW